MPIFNVLEKDEKRYPKQLSEDANTRNECKKAWEEK